MSKIVRMPGAKPPPTPPPAPAEPKRNRWMLALLGAALKFQIKFFVVVVMTAYSIAWGILRWFGAMGLVVFVIKLLWFVCAGNVPKMKEAGIEFVVLVAICTMGDFIYQLPWREWIKKF